MINLFEQYNLTTHELYMSLKQAGHLYPTIVIEDDGFLPEDFISPYQYFSRLQVQPDDRPLYFNEISVPDYWEIEGNNEQGIVKDMGITRALIHYRKNSGSRIVSHVDWLNREHRLQLREHYHRCGFCYARTVYDSSGQKLMRYYYTRTGQTVIYENFVTSDIMLDLDGRTKIFNSRLKFLQYFMTLLDVNMDSIIINSLGLPYAFSYMSNQPGHDYLFWQERTGDGLPGNMSVLLNEQRMRSYTVAVPQQKEYQSLLEQTGEDQRIKPSGYIYRFLKVNGATRNVLTVTNSDQLEHIEEIIISCPDHQFHIAAVTEMSARLKGLLEYRNVRLYPAASMELLRELYNKCDIYLDINHGNEIVNAVRSAFDYNMLILAYDHTAHNKAFTAPEHIFKTNRTAALIELLHRLPEDVDQLLGSQRRSADEISIEQFNKIFK